MPVWMPLGEAERYLLEALEADMPPLARGDSGSSGDSSGNEIMCQDSDDKVQTMAPSDGGVVQ